MANANSSVWCVGAAMLAEKMSAANHNVKDVLIDRELQMKYLDLKRAECFCQIDTEPRRLTGLYCNRTWDNIMCWSDAPAGTTATNSCPPYINKFTTHGFASRLCLPNGTWFSNDVNVNVTERGGVSGWTNFTDCFSDPNPTTFSPDVPALLVKHLLEFRIMYNVGYGLSLVFLILAMTIMIYFKRLHCSRNTIHMNLFVSFIFRASMNLIRDNFVVKGIGFPNDLSFNDSGEVINFTEGPHWECRLFFSIFQYAIAASYMWIFVEAVYIHMLIFVSVFTEKVKVAWFMLFGWSIPLVFVLIWSIARLTLDNSLCWNTTTKKPGLTWILQGPIMLTIVINFFFFISLVWVLYTKLSASPEVRRSKYRTLARSALFLIPVFGVYYIVFTLPLHDLSGNMASIMLFIEMFFNSYQGVFIAVVLCFINTEVRTEIRKAWLLRGVRRGSVTSAAAFRSAKFKSKRETLAVGENTEYEMPVVVVENGNVVPARLNTADEEQPFLEIASDINFGVKTPSELKSSGSESDKNTVATNGNVLATGDRGFDSSVVRDKEPSGRDINCQSNPKDCDTSENNNDKGLRKDSPCLDASQSQMNGRS